MEWVFLPALLNDIIRMATDKILPVLSANHLFNEAFIQRSKAQLGSWYIMSTYYFFLKQFKCERQGQEDGTGKEGKKEDWNGDLRKGERRRGER